MHGIGNDYVYVSAFDQEAPADPSRLAIAISDRHFGVGSDGLILIVPSEVAGRPDADVQRRRVGVGDVRQRACGASPSSSTTTTSPARGG